MQQQRGCTPDRLHHLAALIIWAGARFVQDDRCDTSRMTLDHVMVDKGIMLPCVSNQNEG